MTSPVVSGAKLKRSALIYARPLLVRPFFDRMVDTTYFAAGAALSAGLGMYLPLTFRLGSLLTTVPAAMLVGAGFVVGPLAYYYFGLDKEARKNLTLEGFDKKLAANSPINAPEFRHPRLEALRPELEKHLADNGIPHHIKFIHGNDIDSESGTAFYAPFMLPGGKKVLPIRVSRAVMNMGQPELRAVLTHEISHMISGRFVKKALTAMQAIATGAAIIAGPPSWFGWFMAGMTAAGFELIKSSYSRAVEFRADRIGGLLSKDPLAMADAHAKLGDEPDGILDYAFPFNPSVKRRVKRLEVQAARMVAHGMNKEPVSPVLGIHVTKQMVLTVSARSVMHGSPMPPKADQSAKTPLLASSHFKRSASGSGFEIK